MSTRKVWIALAAVVVLLAGVTFALTRSGEEPKAIPNSQNTIPASQAGGTAPAATPDAAAQQAMEMMNNITSQLQQAVTNGGQPKAITAEEVEAMLRQQRKQLGVR